MIPMLQREISALRCPPTQLSFHERVCVSTQVFGGGLATRACMTGPVLRCTPAGSDGGRWERDLACRTSDPVASEGMAFLSRRKQTTNPSPSPPTALLLSRGKTPKVTFWVGGTAVHMTPSFSLFLPPGCHHCHTQLFFLWLEYRLNLLWLPLKNFTTF